MKMVYSISSEERSSSFTISETITSSASVALPVVLYYICAIISNLHLAVYQNAIQEAIIDLTNKVDSARLVNHNAHHHLQQTLSENEFTFKNNFPQSNFTPQQASWPMSSREKNRLAESPIR